MSVISMIEAADAPQADPVDVLAAFISKSQNVEPGHVALLIRDVVDEFTEEGDLVMDRQSLIIVADAFSLAATQILDNDSPDQDALLDLLDCEDRITIATSGQDVTHNHRLGERAATRVFGLP